MSQFLRAINRSIRRGWWWCAGALDVLSDLPKGLKAFEARLRAVQGEMSEIKASFKETNQDVLFATVGQALTSWATMEEALVIIAGQLLRTSPQKAGLIMYSIFNFATWLAIINGLFELDDELSQYRRRWGKLGERIRQIKDHRDQLAHHPVQMDDADNPLIRPSDLDIRTKSIRQKPLSLEEVNNFSKTVTALSSDLIRLSREMEATLAALKQKSASPSTGPQEATGSQ